MVGTTATPTEVGTLVFPIHVSTQHSVPSTIGIELATNPFMRTGSMELQRSVEEHMPEADFTCGAGVFAATRGLKDKKIYKQGLPVALPLVE